MKTQVLLLIFLLNLACGPSSQNIKNDKVDKKAGYKDLHLDYTYTALKDKVSLTMTLNNQCTATKIYEVSDGPYLKIGSQQFDKVELEFVLDSLYKTTLYGGSTLNGMELMQAYRNEFGEPTSEKSDEFAGEKRQISEWAGKDYSIICIRMSTETKIEYSSYKGLHRSTNEYIKCEDRKLKKAQTDL